MNDGAAIGVGAHLPEPELGRVLTGRGRRWFTRPCGQTSNTPHQ
ncbi:hypothetical protein [Streptomyces sp. Agncl-13]